MKENKDIIKQFYTLEEVAQTLRVNYMTVFRWVKVGKIVAYKVGNHYRVSVADLNAFLEKSKYKAEPAQ